MLWIDKNSYRLQCLAKRWSVSHDVGIGPYVRTESSKSHLYTSHCGATQMKYAKSWYLHVHWINMWRIVNEDPLQKKTFKNVMMKIKLIQSNTPNMTSCD